MVRFHPPRVFGRGYRRPLLRIGEAVVVGVVATLIMAWPVPLALLRWGVIEHHPVLRPGLATGPEGVRYFVSQSKLWLSERYILQPMPFIPHMTAQNETAIPAWLQNETTVPAWVAQSPVRDEALRQVDTQASGWPLRALTSESWMFSRNPVLPSELVREELRPIWPGLLGNTIIFAAAWLGAIGAIGTTRRTLRRRRGRCMGCGYDLRATAPGLECPECGATR